MLPSELRRRLAASFDMERNHSLFGSFQIAVVRLLQYFKQVPEVLDAAVHDLDRALSQKSNLNRPSGTFFMLQK